ncbi:hypothetical protein N7520_006334 [Penicillium odoratum]|uniref:uncharacterized protein n=1 Tax=Penicillium odoratum TaxID=1167516 RepID=UPI0025473D34|nr:uncharacterized protein N7520_006334 [Penicillium odoratum]KAJ5759178.1 hypothetical protein N7520_006334 [Penicillium odoratum]
MSENFGIADIPALTKATWEVYNQCQNFVKDAPDGFRNLVTGLGSLQGVMRTLTDDFISNTAFFERINEDRKLVLERCLNACFETLTCLTSLLNRYRELGISEGKAFWQRIKWTTQRAQVEDIRSKLMVHTCNLSLCVSPIDNSSLDDIERTMIQAMEDDEQAMLAFETSHRDSNLEVSPLSVKSGVSMEYEDIFGSYMPRQNFPRVSSLASRSSQGQEDPSSGQAKHTSTSSGSMMSGSDGSFSGTAPTSITLEPSVLSPIYENSIDGRTSDKIFWADASDIQERQSKSSESSTTEFGHENVMEAVTSAMQQLRQVRLQEQLARPIRYIPQTKLHRPDQDTIKIFESSVNEELQARRLITKDWLRIATWWLLKARATLANSNRHNLVSARGGLALPTSDSRSVSQQAYVDLLKSSYILYEIVLKDENSPVLLTDENRKAIHDLSEGVNDEFSQYTSLDIPEPSSLRAQDLDIWEPLQPEEASERILDFFGLENSRWISVNQDDAGSEEERVLYRAFELGLKNSRTRGAPYMLLLATKEGESEPRIILCNQSGSLCLQRDFVPDDLPQLIHLANTNITGFPGARVSEPVPFMFDNMSVSISFQFEAELGHFINIPRTYFDAVWRREPIDSKEFTVSVIFKGSVEIFEHLKAPSMRPMNPPVIIRSCNVRILERSFGEAWRCTRRMVISPCAAQRDPQCIELFMPLSRVQINREDLSRLVLLKWSDACQERSKTDGNYNILHSYVYDDSAPNIGVGLHFSTQQRAEDFERAILEINFRPDFSWSEPSSSGRIYDVIDTGSQHKQYKAAVILQNKPPWRYSDIYHLYRVTDYVYQHSSLSVRFPYASYTDYISSHVNQLFAADKPVIYSHCEKKTGPATIAFNSDTVARAFMSALSPLYDLSYSRRIQSLSTKSKVLGGKKSGKGGAELQLWRRGNTTQLAARWDDGVSDKWLTMSLPSDCPDSSKENTRVNFPKLPYSRGMSLDMMNIMARTPKSSNLIDREGTISIVFQTAQDREEFLGVLQGRPYSSTFTSLSG